MVYLVVAIKMDVFFTSLNEWWPKRCTSEIQDFKVLVNIRVMTEMRYDLIENKIESMSLMQVRTGFSITTLEVQI